MKPKPILQSLFTTAWLSIILLCSYNSIAQRDAFDLTFTAVEYNDHVQLDSIKVMNRTQGGDTVLYWPDTVLSLYFVGINEQNNSMSAFQLFQNYPNPVTDQTTISFFVPESDQVSILVADQLGRLISNYEKILDKGIHSFKLTPGGSNLYLFTIQWRGISRNIKIMISDFNSDKNCSLEYLGSENISPPLKSIANIQSFTFTPGDELLYIGYLGSYQSGFLDDPIENRDYSFQFTSNIPCPGIPSVTYEGKVYNTVQIFSQCWLKENLDIGIMILGSEQSTDNGIIEKYCFDNDTNRCIAHGGLYRWNELMHYTTQQGAQGICPSGWHVPSDEELKVLEGVADSQYGIVDPIWEIYFSRGFDVGTNLKASSGWGSTGNGTDQYGFSALPGGYWNEGNFADGLGCFWTSTGISVENAWERAVSSGERVSRQDLNREKIGLSVRCILNIE